MEQTATLNSVPSTKAEYEAAINYYLSEMEYMKVEMDERQQRIEKNHVEIRKQIDQLEASL